MNEGRILTFGTRGLLWTTLTVALICGTISFASRMYYAERHAVQSILKNFDGIDYSMLTYEDVVEEVGSVTITIDDIPESRIVVQGLEQYKTSGQFAISEIGKWRFVIAGTTFMGAKNSSTGEPVKSNYWGGYITLGRDSPYRELIPYPTNTLQDIVDHYRELVDYFETWPRESEPGEVILDDGSAQRYYALESGK